MTRKVTAAVLLADGAEEMEATIAIDVLRRAGLDVTVAGVPDDAPKTCSRGVRITPDCGVEELGPLRDLLVLPGGRGGAEQLASSATVGEILKRYEADDRLVGVLCAGPMALARHGVFARRRMTSHPSVREVVAQHGAWSEEPVVRDGALVTSQGPGTAFPFALALVEALLGAEKATEVRAPMMFPS